MRVRVLFFGVLKDLVGRAEEVVEVAPGSTLGSVYASYTERFATLHDKRSSILFARNQEFSKPETMLCDNDEVAFLPPVSGGSGRDAEEQAGGDIFTIIREAIDSQELARRLQRPEDGACVIFEGIVRNNSKGRATSHLEYFAYEELALKQMKRIGAEIAEQFQVGRIGIVHRLGLLQIGEASVVIVVTSPHRKAAFTAALESIDRLKREVPIWKKEFFADGEEWVDGEWSADLAHQHG